MQMAILKLEIYLIIGPLLFLSLKMQNFNYKDLYCRVACNLFLHMKTVYYRLTFD